MIRRATKTLVFFAVFCALFVGLSRLSDHYPASKNEGWFLRSIQEPLKRTRGPEADSIHALAIGSSHAGRISFHVLGVDGVAFTLPLGDFFETEYMARALVPRLPGVDTVYVSVSFYSFCWDSALASEDGFKYGRFLCYSLLGRWQPIPGDLKNWIRGRLRPLVRTDHWEGVFHGIGQGRAAFEPASLDVALPAEAGGHDVALSRHALRRTTAVMNQMTLMVKQDPLLAERAEKSLVRTAAYLRQRGVCLIFFTPPFYEAYINAFRPEYIEDMRTRMGKLSQNLRVPYFDFSTNALWSANADLFADSDHVAPRGSTLMTQELLTRLRSTDAGSTSMP